MQASLERKTLSVIDIVDQLSQHLMCCHSGTFLIATNDNRSCRVSLNAGRVTHCSFGRIHGDAAFQKIADIQAGTYSFIKNAPQPTKERSQVKNKHTVDQLIQTLKQQSESHSKRENQETLPSGLTDKQMESLFGKFHFE
jgi:hypothetical protein